MDDLIARLSLVDARVKTEDGDLEQTRSNVDQLWSALAGDHDFRQLEIAEDQSLARFYNGNTDNGLTVQAPYLRFSRLPLTGPLETDAVAAEAQRLFTTAAQTIGGTGFSDVRLYQVYTVEIGTEAAAAKALIESRMFSLSEDDLAALQTSGDGSQWTGMRVVLPRGDDRFVLGIEPWVGDDMRSLYVDLDARFSGDSEQADFENRLRDAREYIEGPVASYLERLTA